MNKQLDKMAHDLRAAFEIYAQTQDDNAKDKCWKAIFNILGAIKDHVEKQGMANGEVVGAETYIRQLECILASGNFDEMSALLDEVDKEIKIIS